MVEILNISENFTIKLKSLKSHILWPLYIGLMHLKSLKFLGGKFPSDLLNFYYIQLFCPMHYLYIHRRSAYAI
jgi:hypothetical protein